MGAAEVIAFEEVCARKQWDTLCHQLHERFDQWLDTLETQWHEPPSTFPEVTATVWTLRQQLTGGITETIVQYAHEGERQPSRYAVLQAAGRRAAGVGAQKGGEAVATGFQTLRGVRHTSTAHTALTRPGAASWA